MTSRQMPSFDRTDQRILDILQSDGRISFVDLAKRVNLTTTPCVERVRRLERTGVITGYKAVVDAEKMGLSMTVFVEAKLDHTTPDALERFRSAVLEMDNLIECYLIAGGFDYLLKLQIADITAYRHFLAESLPRLTDIQQTRSYIVVEQLKGAAGQHRSDIK